MMRRALALLLGFWPTLGYAQDAAPNFAAGVTLTWMHAGAPSAGIEVRVFEPFSGRRLATFRSDADGRVLQAIPLHFQLELRDPVRGVVLASRVALTAEGRVRVPEPIRVIGRIASASRNDAPIVRVGYGWAIRPTERRRLEARRMFPRLPEEEPTFGLNVPRSPSRWQNARVSGGRFDSGWITAEDEVEVVAFDGAHVGIAAVPLPRIVKPGQAIDAGTIHLASARSMEVSVDAPATDIPLAFLAGVREASFEDGAGAAAARHLSVLDQIDPRAFDLLMMRVPIALPASGRTRVRGLPPLSRLTLTLDDVAAGVSVTRDLVWSNGPTARLRLTKGELLPPGSNAERRDIGGRVVYGTDDAAVAGATVVYSVYPDRRETRTDEEGRFVIPDVRTDVRAGFFVDARRSAGPADVRRTQLFRGIEPGTAVELRLERNPDLITVPRQARGNVGNGGTCSYPTTNDEYPSVDACVIGPNGCASVAIGTMFDPVKDLVYASIPSPGQWHFTVAKTAFQVYTGAVTATSNGFYVIPTNPVGNTVEFRNLHVTRRNFPVANATVFFASFVTAPDPLVLQSEPGAGLVRPRPLLDVHRPRREPIEP